jgi:ABC-type Zn2+ transport system substrate-binding protein/surface adhesin
LDGRVDKEISDREVAISELNSRMDQNNSDRNAEMDELKRKLMRENLFLKKLAGRPLSVYFDAYRTKAYDGGGEENLTFNVLDLIEGLTYYY